MTHYAVSHLAWHKVSFICIGVGLGNLFTKDFVLFDLMLYDPVNNFFSHGEAVLSREKSVLLKDTTQCL